MVGTFRFKIEQLCGVFMGTCLKYMEWRRHAQVISATISWRSKRLVILISRFLGGIFVVFGEILCKYLLKIEQLCTLLTEV